MNVIMYAIVPCSILKDTDSNDHAEGTKRITNKLWLYKIRQVC